MEKICRGQKTAFVPVEVRVIAIFSAMIPLLPTPGEDDEALRSQAGLKKCGGLRLVQVLVEVVQVTLLFFKNFFQRHNNQYNRNFA